MLVKIVLERKLTFKFSGKMARLLGRESVSSDVAALFELVKNTYDADATKVEIRFENFSNATEEPTISVIDNGDGMTFDEIEKNWMIIGTYSKDRNQRSRKGRRVVGNKGIGRFSTEKLAQSMLLISRSSNSSEEIRLQIDWADYEQENVTFDDIKHTAEIIPKRPNQAEHGTQIVLSILREQWTIEKIDKLRTSITSMILPPELQAVTGDSFDVEIVAPDFPEHLSSKIHSLLFKHAPFKLTAVLPEKSSECYVHLFKMGKEERKERIDLKDQQLESGSKWQQFGKCKLTAYFYPGRSRYEEWDKYYYTALKIAKIQEHMEDIHGIKIYRDNFWVRPYGEKGNDWLELEKDRVQSNLKVGNTQVIGFIEITKDGNPLILDTTTRERLVDNDAFESMKVFAKGCFGVLNKYRIEENKVLREKAGRKEHKHILEEEIKYLNEIIDNLGEIPHKEKKVMKQSLKNVERIFTDFKGESEEDYEQLEAIERAYRNLATLGISSATTTHEIGNIVAIAAEIPKSIWTKLGKKPLNKRGIQQDLDEIDNYFKTIRKYLRFIRRFVLSIKEQFEATHEKEMIEIKPTLEELFSSFAGIFENKSIVRDVRVSPSDLRVYMNRAELYSVLVNLITNSIKALDLLSDNAEKIIRITVRKEAHDLSILFSNNGPIIDEEIRDKVFDLFFSKYKEGTGMGLSIVREIIREYNGKIIVKNETEFEPGATFEIKIPLEALAE